MELYQVGKVGKWILVGEPEVIGVQVTEKQS